MRRIAVETRPSSIARLILAVRSCVRCMDKTLAFYQKRLMRHVDLLP